jgi:hypothetical protein
VLRDDTHDGAVVWVGLDGDEIVAGHLLEHRKVRNIRNDSRVVLSIETDKRNAIGLNEYLVIYGTAHITEGARPNFSSGSPVPILGRMSASRPWTTHHMDTSRTSWWIGSPVWAPGHSADSSVYGQQVAGLCQQGRQDPADAGTANRLPTGEYRPVPGRSSATAPASGEGACTQPRRTAGASALLAVPTRKTWVRRQSLQRAHHKTYQVERCEDPRKRRACRSAGLPIRCLKADPSKPPGGNEGFKGSGPDQA